MSDLLQLSKLMRSMSDAELAALVRRREVNSNPKDFLDLAQFLLTPKAIEQCFATLTSRELEVLKQADGRTSELELLLTSGLVCGSRTELRVIDAAKPLLAELPDFQNLPAKNLEPLEQAAELAAITAFETQQAITELLIDAQGRFVRVVSRNAVGLPDVKQLSQALHKNLEFARGCYQMAQNLGLLQPRDSRWWCTARAQTWLKSTPIERWLMLADSWLADVTELGRQELARHASPTSDLTDSLRQVFPLADKTLSKHLQNLADRATWLGLSVSARPTEALLALLREDTASAREIIEQHLPKTQRKLLAQGDQTLVAPGPLPTDLELEIRTFAKLEQVSLASTYRITEESLNFALECGLTEQQIRNTLASVTAGELPQSIDYLLKQATSRFGRIRILSGSGLERSQVKAADRVLLTEILNDQRLRPFAFHPVNASTLATRFEPDVVYFALRENGFLATRMDSDGKPISPKQQAEVLTEADAQGDAAERLIAELRKVDSRLGENPTDDDLLRQLQLAIKNRATVKVHLTMRDGRNVVYELKVSGLANGRLRGLDSKADAERVLPMSQVTLVEF